MPIFRNFKTKHRKPWVNGKAKEFIFPFLGHWQRLGNLSFEASEYFIFLCSLVLLKISVLCCFLEGGAYSVKGNLEGFELRRQC